MISSLVLSLLGASISLVHVAYAEIKPPSTIVPAVVSSLNPQLLDPTISTSTTITTTGLIDKDGNLKDNLASFASTLAHRSGTIADGMSKLILVVTHGTKLQFSMKNTKASNNLTDGTLSPFVGVHSSTNTKSVLPSSSSSVAIADPQPGNSIVAVVYTPPDFFKQTNNLQQHRIVKVLISDPGNPAGNRPIDEVSIDLYRPPIILVHGIWTNAYLTWNKSKFTQTLAQRGLSVNCSNPAVESKVKPTAKAPTSSSTLFNVYCADYGSHNATTFDPYANKTNNGNYGIQSINRTITNALENYHDKSIAATQVDVVGHSMGGLMARGYTQQQDYKNPHNYMKGYIHRLITIGTPHFGGQLAGPLYNHRENWYCFDPTTNITLFPAGCQSTLGQFDFMPLKTIYAFKLHTPLDKGGVEALIPGSIAYSHLCQTDVKSYAIAGSWEPYGLASHAATESFFQNILGNPLFNLDRDGFHGVFQGNNDLQVNLTSQSGGLHSSFRHLGSASPSSSSNNNSIPSESEVYPNTVHSDRFVFDNKTIVSAETYSRYIQQDVVTLLSSPGDKFANAIGIGSPCHIPTK